MSDTWKKRHHEAERLRIELIARLDLLAKKAGRYPGYKSVRKLLSEAYHQETLSKRLAVLKAASWLITVVEETTLVI